MIWILSPLNWLEDLILDYMFSLPLGAKLQTVDTVCVRLQTIIVPFLTVRHVSPLGVLYGDYLVSNKFNYYYIAKLYIIAFFLQMQFVSMRKIFTLI